MSQKRYLSGVTITALCAVTLAPPGRVTSAVKEYEPPLLYVCQTFSPNVFVCDLAVPSPQFMVKVDAGSPPVTVQPLRASTADFCGPSIVGVVTTLFDTVTLLPAVEAVLPAASFATALMVCAPLLAVVEFHAIEYGAVVSSAPTFVPSTLNCTPTTPTLSGALAEMVTVPETVAPSAGAVRETVGLVVSLPLVTSTLASQVVLAPTPAPVTVAV